MRLLNFALVIGCLCAPAFADELGEAQKLWDSKQYNAAFAAFSKLAEAGNPGAQLQLGEMYGFGEGTPEDLARARQWLGKAAGAGHPDAASSLALVNERAARKSDIAYYMDKFDGNSARYENFQCTQPVLPQVSTSRGEIKAVNQSITEWRACYDSFADNLGRVAAPDKTIPADVLALMNNEEFQRASRHIEKIYAEINTAASKEGEDFYKNINGWMARTAEYLEKSRQGDESLMKRLVAENASFVRAHAETVQRVADAQGRRK